MDRVRVVVTRIEPDGTMQRRVVETAQQSDPRHWADLAARALAVQPLYHPVPGTAVYHIHVGMDTVQAGEYDLEGPLRDLVTMVLAMGSQTVSGTSDLLDADPPGEGAAGAGNYCCRSSR
jgi:hypothetical protein